MSENTTKTIKEKVRKNYGKIALQNKHASELLSEATSCCDAPSPSLEQMSTVMGYSKEEVQAVPEGANLGLGCGNPVALGEIKEGETVVDLGSGAGFDCFLAAGKVGKTGKVIGVDMTAEMISKARQNVERTKAANVEFRLGEIEHLPIADNTADAIISNCVINLSPEKKAVFQEAFRVLKPGGRLSISDILATQELPENIQNNLTLISACIGGAATISSVRSMLEEIGFETINIDEKQESRELINKWLPGSNAGNYVASAYIEARKPVYLKKTK